MTDDNATDDQRPDPFPEYGVRELARCAGISQSAERPQRIQQRAPLAATDHGGMKADTRAAIWPDASVFTEGRAKELMARGACEDALHYVGKKRAGRTLDGVIHDAMPEVSR